MGLTILVLGLVVFLGAHVFVTLRAPRAAVIKQSLERQNRKLAPRVAAEGVGSREIIVGLGSDDLRDALDRRVEFRTVDCS